MSLEIEIFDLSYKQPLDSGPFFAGLDEKYREQIERVRETFRIYQEIGAQIIRERTIIHPDSVNWGFHGWAA